MLCGEHDFSKMTHLK